jgi:3-oxo-5-alpha-steroid 4-dehydrogenase 1
MMTETLFNTLLYVWMGMAVAIVPVLLKVTPPYGRHTSDSWGPTISSKWGWIIMEIPVIIVFSFLFLTGDAEKSLPLYIFYGLFMIHYFNRVFIFPFRIKENGKRMPVLIVAMAFFFNLCNGFFNGYWFGNFALVYELSWFYDWRFILGLIMFLTGMYINMSSDNILLGLRKGGKKGYFIPYGGMFRYVSSPNLFGEIIEWSGWAILCWCMPAFSFALWTMANLIPRAIDHHRWYKRRFENYPKERKAVIPFVV